MLQGSSAGLGGDCLRIRFANELGGLSGLAGMPASDHNLYSRPGGCRFFDQRPGSLIDADAGVYPMVGPGQPYEAMITGDWIPSRKQVDVKPPGASEMF